MEFGPVPVRDAAGCVLAHATKVGAATFKKGRVLSVEDCAALEEADVTAVIAARLAGTDIDEDTAADRIAVAAQNSGLVLGTAFTGRVNLHADVPGLFVAREEAVNAVNRIDPAITLATLANYTPVSEGRMVATSKIIPFGVSDHLVRQAEACVKGALTVHPFRARKIGLVATELPHLKPSTMDKTRRVLEDRLRASNSSIVDEKRVPHTEEAAAAALAQLDAAGADVLILFGASAVVDRQDVLPAAIEKAGGTVLHFGMPVDPGNLLLLGDLNGKPVLGAPGCARSPKENGFDWVLDRLLADLPVTPQDITGMGVGGLLMEIESRPQPRDPKPSKPAPKIAAIILAAGKSSRMQGQNKLLAPLDGKPVLRHVADAALGTELSQVVAVTGHMQVEVCAVLDGLPIRCVHNARFADGMAGSIKTGLDALGADVDAVLVLLGDMPGLASTDLEKLISVYRSPGAPAIVAAAAHGTRRNPVLWDKRHFTDLETLSGDKGARDILDRLGDRVALVEIGGAAELDVDTPAALEAARKMETAANAGTGAKK